MGGSVGLKGTDGLEILREALKSGARPVAPEGCVQVLLSLKRSMPSLNLLTSLGDMGEKEAISSNVAYELLPVSPQERTTAEDTNSAAKHLEARDVKLLLFAGGDGMARR